MLYVGLGISVLAFAGVWFAPRISQQLFRESKVDADLPCAFGCKMAWIAVRTRDTAKLIEALQLKDAHSVNWSLGIGTIYSDRIGLKRVFVTPPIDGWSFVVGLSLPHPMGDAFEDHCSPLLSQLSRAFGTVHYFASLPELEYFAWVVLREGQMVRGFACGSEGVMWNRGPVTVDEYTVNNAMFDIRLVGDDSDAGYVQVLREEHVLELARRWSLDPTRLDMRDDLEAGIGYLATAPVAWQPVSAIRRHAA